MKLTLHVWRQKDTDDKGGFATYELADVNTHMSFLEMLDVVNERLQEKGDEPIHFDHDAAVGAGLAGVVVHGLLMGAWIVDAASGQPRLFFQPRHQPVDLLEIRGPLDLGQYDPVDAPGRFSNSSIASRMLIAISLYSRRSPR